MKKLAIVGLAAGNESAPKLSAHWDVWRLNPGFWLARSSAEVIVGTSAWFEIHTRRYLTKAHGPEYARSIEQIFNFVSARRYFLNPKEWRAVTNARVFPRAQIAQAFPRGDYHAGSFDWLLAFALLQGYKFIEMFGVDLGPTDNGEPISARPCLEYWCGVAAGRGVEVVSHSPSLFKIFNYQRATTPYHYDDTWRLVEDRRKP